MVKLYIDTSTERLVDNGDSYYIELSNRDIKDRRLEVFLDKPLTIGIISSVIIVDNITSEKSLRFVTGVKDKVKGYLFIGSDKSASDCKVIVKGSLIFCCDVSIIANANIRAWSNIIFKSVKAYGHMRSIKIEAEEGNLYIHNISSNFAGVGAIDYDSRVSVIFKGKIVQMTERSYELYKRYITGRHVCVASRKY